MGIKTVCTLCSIAVLLISSCASAASEDCQHIDTLVAASLNKLYSSSAYAGNYDEHINTKAGTSVYNRLDNYLKQSSSFNCAFRQSQKQGLTLKTSADNRLRAYSWDTADGGTMHNFTNYIQYQDVQGSVHAQQMQKDEELLHAYPSDLLTLQLNKKPYTCW